MLNKDIFCKTMSKLFQISKDKKKSRFSHGVSKKTPLGANVYHLRLASIPTGVFKCMKKDAS